jgi:hypothetical protein
LDGSHHKWFEERGPQCTLLVSIDDATGEVIARFEEEESTIGYFCLMQEYIEKHGVPEALYTDRYSTFKTNQGEKNNLTQFGRAMKELGVEMIFARTPQAKGRVERANGTLQDRLVKELRLQKISTIEEANTFLPEFLTTYNQRFSKEPRSPINAHRELSQKENLEHILCEKAERTISKDLEVSYEGQIYQLQAFHNRYRLQRKKVTIIRTLEGKVLIEYEGQRLEHKILQEVIYQPPILDSKELVAKWEKKKWKPSKNHPWKKFRKKKELIMS